MDIDDRRRPRRKTISQVTFGLVFLHRGEYYLKLDVIGQAANLKDGSVREFDGDDEVEVVKTRLVVE